MARKPRFVLETDHEPLAWGYVDKWSFHITAQNVHRHMKATILILSGDVPILMSENFFDVGRATLQYQFCVFSDATQRGFTVEIEADDEKVRFSIEGDDSSRCFPVVDPKVLTFNASETEYCQTKFDYTRALLTQPGHDYYVLMAPLDRPTFLNILASGLFVLGDEPRSGMPAAAQRYSLFPCSSPRNWLSKRSLPKQIRNIRFSLNEVDPTYVLSVAAAYHNYGGRSNWLTAGLIKMIADMMKDQQRGVELRASLAHGVITKELNETRLKFIDRHPSLRVLKSNFSVQENMSRAEDPIESEDGKLPWPVGMVDCEKGSELEKTLVSEGGIICRGDVKIEFLNFEAWIPKDLWMKQFWEIGKDYNLEGLSLTEAKMKVQSAMQESPSKDLLLLLCDCPSIVDPCSGVEYLFSASTCSYMVGGGALCDYTVTNHCSPKDVGLGGVLAKVVAETLKLCDVKLWYWGMELPYMKAFSPYGGRSVPRYEFYSIWQSEAWDSKTVAAETLQIKLSEVTTSLKR